MNGGLETFGNGKSDLERTAISAIFSRDYQRIH